jgi:hypothetical protein
VELKEALKNNPDKIEGDQIKESLKRLGAL